ncbi:MAG: hypothetical protein V4646_16105 [Pseudomonadota bacterium]
MNLLKYFKRDPQPQTPPLSAICPNCHQEDTRPRNLARKIGGVLGAVAGAACGVYGILGTDRIGMGDVRFPHEWEEFRADPIAIAAATLRGLLGATTGALVGIRLGEIVDAHLLENQACRHCGHPFGEGVEFVQRPTPFEPASQQAGPGGYASGSGSGFFSPRFGEPPTDVDLDEEDEAGTDFPSRLPPFGFALQARDLTLGTDADLDTDTHPDSCPVIDPGQTTA